MLVGILTGLTLVAFAANSLLCRLALGGGRIDPLSFTALRLVSGALVLLAVARVVPDSDASRSTRGTWGSAFALFTYAAAFSLAYQSLSTGMGALILFGAVQVTMIAAALHAGEHLRPLQWTGSAAAAGGLVYLTLPGISAPDPAGAALMGVAGVAWGMYSIRGRGAAAPVAMTAGNFLRTVPMALIAGAAGFSSLHLERSGVLLAVVSGGVTSGLGYVLWYTVLRSLTTGQASVVQLLVPVLAAFGGVAFLAEHVSVRLVAASAVILGGTAMAVCRPAPPRGSR
jgi:drug/metabolite transporter (DMT)-like permease